MSTKIQYITFIEQISNTSIFSQAWWLDIVTQNGTWDVCIYQEKGKILGTLLYYITTYNGQKVIRMPKLTPYLGIQFFPTKQLSPSSQFAFESKVAKALIKQLPATIYFQQNQHPSFSNWLPFFWEGYNQKTRYTFRLNIHDINITYAAFRKNLKRNLRKAEQELYCEASDDLSLFYELNKTTFERQKLNIPYSIVFLQQLDKQLKERKRRKIFITYAQNKKAIAAGYFVWDHHTAYYLAGGHTGNREAMSWTMWYAIQYFSNKVQVFDFEGSMIKNIAHFFSGFGATQVPYHHIYKGKNKLIDVLKLLKP